MRVFLTAFSQAYSPGQWLLLFYLCAFAGWCWEVALHLFRERRFVNRGFLTGPLLPIYGFGALLVLFVGLPLAHRPLLCALAGTLAASVLEYLTGEAMEALFHVRYWDYSDQKWNLRGHICLLSSAVWAVMAWLMTCAIHPLLSPVLHRVPESLALCAGLTLTAFVLADLTASVHRALDLRALLESMERYASELEALHGGLDSVTDRVADALRAFAAQVEERGDALEDKLRAIEAAREQLREAISERRLNAGETARARFAGYERVLSEITSDLPDLRELRQEIARAKERFEQKSEYLHDAKILARMKKAQRMLRRNPGASSAHHRKALDRILSRKEEDEHYGTGK